MTLRYEKRLISHLSHEGYEPKHFLRVGQELRVEDEKEFAEAVKELAGRGVVHLDESGTLTLPSYADGPEVIEGEFRKAVKGFGFVLPDRSVREGDLFIPERQTMDAMSGDRVRAAVQRDRRRERGGSFSGKQFSGEIIEILERRRTTFSGEVYKQGETWLVEPDGKHLTQPIVIRDAEAKHVKPGDKVVVDITDFPEGDYLPEGVISKVLGEAGMPDVETQAVILAHGLPGEFPDEVLDHARGVTRAFDSEIAEWERTGTLEGRADLTGEFIITIDPPDAKDYDDAISIEATPEGGWKLGVHIADVGHFIEPGSPLDVEARERGNSVYLPRLVIPMLPEILSNGICSLQEGVPRYAKSAFGTYDKRGNLVAQGVGSSLIKSAKRLTYLEAQALIDGDEEEAKKHAKTEPNYTPELIETLKRMDACARAIRGRRERDGMISLELPEVELIFNEDGKVIDAEREDDAFTHTVIEMFMVEANEILARLFEKLHVPLLRRVHPEPTPGDSDALQKAATVAGYKIPKHPTREELQGLLNATRGTPAARAVHMAVLRTLTKAEYSPALLGHFALASAAYAHFTSPIRRYPDLTVHWALAAYLERTDNARKRPKDDQARKNLGRDLMDDPRVMHQEDLVTLGRHCSMTENRAEEAERELRQFLVLQLLAEHVGEDFEGVITGVTQRGVFVQLSKFLADGMIKTSDLPGDVTRSNKPPFWKIDARTGALVDQNSGRSYSMGDPVKVRVAKVDLARRQMDLLIADAEARAKGKAKPVAGLTLGGGVGGGLEESGRGAGFKTPGDVRRSRKSKQRDRGKTDYRRESQGQGKAKKKGKRK
ncbi:MAG: ribonuclease R family protein [Phycisphaerales bacterium JB037]